MLLFRRRQMWWPTWSGWSLLLVLLLAGPTWWWFQGEALLAETQRVEAEVLAVEGWIDGEAIRSAAREFQNGCYQYVVGVSGLTYETALAVQRVLDEHDIQPTGVNVFTDNVHARRSRIVFAKVFGTSSAVGVIGWPPPGFDDDDWRQSSDRARSSSWSRSRTSTSACGAPGADS